MAPWCKHCTKLKPTWDSLKEEYEGSAHVLLAEVDCTSADGAPLCDQHNIDGYPQLKFGDPSDLQEYEGTYKYDSLKSLVMSELEPDCSPDLIHLCNREQREAMEDYMAMDVNELDELIEEAEAERDEEYQRINDQYDELTDEMDLLREARDGVVSAVTPVLQLLKEVRRTMGKQEENAAAHTHQRARVRGQ